MKTMKTSIETARDLPKASSWRLPFYGFCVSMIVVILGLALAISHLAAELTSKPEPGGVVSSVSDYYLISFIMFALGATGCIFTRIKMKIQAHTYETFFIITFCWCATSLLGAVPYLFEGMKWDDAILESFSLFTTTGTQISPGMPLRDTGSLVALSNTLIFYRCICAWLGGMGTIVLLLIFLPIFKNTQMLPYAEVSGLKSIEQRASMGIGRSAWNICTVYILLTSVQAILLFAVAHGENAVSHKSLTWFDAICYALTTISTSGVCPGHDTSIFEHGTWAVWITIIFMMLASFNFNVYVISFTDTIKRFHHKGHADIKKSTYKLFNDETKFFLFGSMGAAIVIFLQILLLSKNLDDFQYKETITESVFSCISFMSTTGFSSAPGFALPSTAIIVLLILCMLGGCSGSTSSGLKSYRCILIFKHAVVEIERIFFPHRIKTIYLNHERYDKSIIGNIFAFFALFVVVLLFFAIVIPIFSPGQFKHFSDAFALSVSTLTNTGYVWAVDGNFNTFEMTCPAKLLLVLEMLLGRLEIFTVLVLFIPQASRFR